jgi:L-alanine-DL-glutamate epimerase-like enolase superfamily enzyme
MIREIAILYKIFAKPTNMNTNRRQFLARAAAIGAVPAVIPLSSCNPANVPGSGYPDYSALDRALEKPVLKRELFPDPVIIESLELLRDRNNTICRVRSKDGVEGISIGHPFIAKNSWPMFKNLLHDRFVGKDARDLDELIYYAAEGPVKNQGIPLCVQIASIEFAILDMLGIIADKPVGLLIGELENPEIAIYLGHRLWELRNREPEVSLEMVRKDAEETQTRAIKIRAGRGDNLATDIDNAPGRTEKLIRMAREMFGDEMVLMIDGNGSYSVREAIRIGRILEEYNYYWYEEPVPWDWYEEQVQVAKELNITMAGGEEEFGMHAFRWLIANGAFQIIMPDLFYNGGMIRSMKVARMAEAAGIQTSPHISGGGLGFLYMIHMVSACPAASEYHEFKMFGTRDANGTTVPIESKAGPFESVDGLIKAPEGAGLGVTIDPDYIKTHTKV